MYPKKKTPDSLLCSHAASVFDHTRLWRHLEHGIETEKSGSASKGRTRSPGYVQISFKKFATKPSAAPAAIGSVRVRQTSTVSGG